MPTVIAHQKMMRLILVADQATMLLISQQINGSGSMKKTAGKCLVLQLVFYWMKRPLMSQSLVSVR